MSLFRTASSILITLLACHALAPVSNAERALPDSQTFMRDVRDAIRLDDQLQNGFIYIERRRDLRLSRTGKVTVGPLRTFEVHPSSEPGRTYKRLIAVDGKPLDPAELWRRDVEHRRDLGDLAMRERAETPEQRQRRLRDKADARWERDAILNDALAVYAVTLVGRDTHDGEPMIVAELTPRPDVRVTTREGGWMKQLTGRVWISEVDHQIARFDLRALDDISIGWGILGRVHEGSRFTHTRRKIDGTWLPAEVTFEASGRTLLFRKFRIRTVTTYSDYRRNTESQYPASSAGDRISSH